MVSWSLKKSVKYDIRVSKKYSDDGTKFRINLLQNVKTVRIVDKTISDRYVVHNLFKNIILERDL